MNIFFWKLRLVYWMCKYIFGFRIFGIRNSINASFDKEMNWYFDEKYSPKDAAQEEWSYGI